MRIDRIKRVPLRQVWRNEALNLTTWLEQNLDLLNEHLDFALDPENVRREVGAGAFSVDLVAEDDAGRTVVIENQLERSDHDHLGKLLTYLVMLDASIAIWIVGHARPEHVKVVTWLNDTPTPVSAYLFKLEAVTIGDSDPAPLLTAIVSPSEGAREAATTKAEKTERHRTRRAFWEALLAHATQRTRLHANISPGDGPYLSTGSGLRGVNWMYGVRQHETRVTLWIDRGEGTESENEALFNQLYTHKDEVEAAYGGPLEWENKDKNRSCKVNDNLTLGGWRDEDRWDKVIEQTVEAMIRLESALGPQVAKLTIPTETMDEAEVPSDPVMREGT